VLYYQVGIGDGNKDIDGDHDPWRLPEKDDQLKVTPTSRDYFVKYRPVFAVGDAVPKSPISPNLAGRVAAAFALYYQTFHVSDATTARRCLTNAEAIYALAEVNPPPKKLLTASPFDYYPESEWRDDMELAAHELFRACYSIGAHPTSAIAGAHGCAKSANAYLQDAAAYAQAYIKSSDQDSLNLYDVGALAHFELYHAITTAMQHNATLLGHNFQLSTMADTLLTAVGKQIAGAMKLEAKDAFRLGVDYKQGSDITPHAWGLALTGLLFNSMLHHNPQSSSPPAHAPTAHQARVFAQKQLDWIFGNNVWGSSFVVGAGSVFPHCLQHQVANLVGSLDGKATATHQLLLGAVVDGPNQLENFSGLGVDGDTKKCPSTKSDAFKQYSGQGVRYEDNVAAWPSTEPADDYSVLQVYTYVRLMGHK